MSPLESRAWLQLWGICPAYAVYFMLQVISPAWLAGMPVRIACLAVAAGVHVAVFLAGYLRLRRKERGEGLLADERDRAIETRATGTAYSALLIGAVFAGMILPFSQGGWAIVNAMLLVIVLSEVLRNSLIVQGYRGTPRLAL